jgi:putative ABC transport system ATP-binding protein
VSRADARDPGRRAGEARRPVVEAENVSCAFAAGRRRVEAVRDLTLAVNEGEFVGLVGPSGSGKSSLLFLLAGLLTPSAGRVRYRGAPWPADRDLAAGLRRRELGFVFQEPFLVPWLTVRENATAHALPGTPPARLARLADRLGIGDLLDERPACLSLGERQRAGILRALVNEPRLVLADEPTANLDRANAARVVDLLTENLGGSALLLVTHDPLVLAGAHRVRELADGVLTG